MKMSKERSEKGSCGCPSPLKARSVASRSQVGGSPEPAGGKSLLSSKSPTKSRAGRSQVSSRLLDRHGPCRRTCSTYHNPMFACGGGGSRERPGASKFFDDLTGLPIDKNLDWRKTEIDQALEVSAINTSIAAESPEKSRSNRDPRHATASSLSASRASRAGETSNDWRGQRWNKLVDDVLKTKSANRLGAVMNPQEVGYYATIAKEPALLESNLGYSLDKVIGKAQKTFDSLMSALMLKKELQLMTEGFKKKLHTIRLQTLSDDARREAKAEVLKKILARVKKLYEARHVVTKILIRIRQRAALLKEYNDIMTADEARKFYRSLLGQSARLHGLIERMRSDNPLLQRPFVYEGENLQSRMVKQQLEIRNSLRDRFKELKKDADLSQILDRTGKIIAISELVRLNLNEGYASDLASERGGRSNTPLPKRSKDRRARLTEYALRSIHLNDIKSRWKALGSLATDRSAELLRGSPDSKQ